MLLRLASYNLHKCVGTDGRRDPGRVIDVINGLGADIVALQEVDRRFGPRPAALPPALIDRESDYVALPLCPDGESLGWHGQTLLVRGPTVHAIDRLSLPGLEPRGAVLAELTLAGGGPLRVLGVHLGLRRRDRQRQLHTIAAALCRLAPMPTAILGDFNEWSPGRGLDPLRPAFDIHAPGLSFHAARPMAALDRIALGAGLRLADAGVIETPLARAASDHLPVWAEVVADATPTVRPEPTAAAAG